jgi:energy-coupling factor transporter ATP-binding protein EcfA2
VPNSVLVRDVGPIQELKLDLKPGVTVLVGENGSGKSKTLEAVDALTSGSGKLQPRDGTLGGEVSGFGVRISVGHSTRRFGDPRFVSLGERLDVAALVDPGLKSPEANDAARIKALVGLTGVQAEPALFYELVGGQEEFERLVKKSSIVLEDPVEMARRVKKDLEEAARQARAPKAASRHERGFDSAPSRRWPAESARRPRSGQSPSRCAPRATGGSGPTGHTRPTARRLAVARARASRAEC